MVAYNSLLNGVIGSDDRIKANDPNYRIFFGVSDNDRFSGVLVGNHTLLTNAHNVYDFEKQEIIPSYWSPGFDSQNYNQYGFAEATITYVNSEILIDDDANGVLDYLEYSNFMRGEDWAVISLDRDYSEIGGMNALFYEDENDYLGLEVTSQGYPGSVIENGTLVGKVGEQYVSTGTITDYALFGPLYSDNIDISSGNSGGPIYTPKVGGSNLDFLYGLSVATSSSGENVFVPITPIIKDVISTYEEVTHLLEEKPDLGGLYIQTDGEPEVSYKLSNSKSTKDNLSEDNILTTDINDVLVAEFFVQNFGSGSGQYVIRPFLSKDLQFDTSDINLYFEELNLFSLDAQDYNLHSLTINFGDIDLWGGPLDPGQYYFGYTLAVDGSEFEHNAAANNTVIFKETIIDIQEDGLDVHRFFDADRGVHFYSANPVEVDYVMDNLSNYTHEGVAYEAKGDTTVHRFLNQDTGVHLYTIDDNEVNYISNNLDNYSYEGEVFEVHNTATDDTLPVHRFYEPNIGVHFFTANQGEAAFVRDNLSNYDYEGIAYHVFEADAIL